jgi:hypothetical protein
MGRQNKRKNEYYSIDIKEDSFLDLDYVTDEKGKRLDVKNYEIGK